MVFISRHIRGDWDEVCDEDRQANEDALRNGADESSVSVFLGVLDETADQPDASELRLRLAEAVESLTDSFRILVPLARRLLRDRLGTCQLHGLHLVERLGERNRRLLPMLVPNVVPLLEGEVTEVRAIAQKIMGVSQS